VKTTGIAMKLLLYADNWDTLIKVSNKMWSS